MTDTPKILSIVELPDAIKASFETIYRYEKTIEALHAKHIEPVAAERTAVWRDLKAGADMTRKDLELGYRIFKRWQEAQDMEDLGDEQRQHLIRTGGHLNWIWAAFEQALLSRAVLNHNSYDFIYM